MFIPFLIETLWNLFSELLRSCSAWICKNKIKYCHLRSVSDANINTKYLVGSSIKIKWGLPSIAIAAQSFLFVPPLRSWHLFIAWACRSRSSIDFFTTWINDVTFVIPLTYIFIQISKTSLFEHTVAQSTKYRLFWSKWLE